MSLLTLEHLRLSCEPLITNRTLGYSAGDVGSVGSAHQAQDVQVSLPSDGLKVFAISVHSTVSRSVDKAACYLNSPSYCSYTSINGNGLIFSTFNGSPSAEDYNTECYMT